MNRRFTILWIWLAIIALLIISYFFFPNFFAHLFHDPGPGSPYVNTP